MSIVVGIDEVGRGCWAGPVVACAAVLNKPVKGLNDSKKLSKAKREKLFKEILINGEVGIGWVSADYVDDIGLSDSVTQAMALALYDLNLDFTEVIIDGNQNFLDYCQNTRAVIGADGTIAAVSAASIVAKVLRDNYMVEMSAKYPRYGFESHVGYGTKQHVAALEANGPCKIHRMSYKPLQRFAL